MHVHAAPEDPHPYYFYDTRISGDGSDTTFLIGSNMHASTCGGGISGEDVRWFITCGAPPFFSLRTLACNAAESFISDAVKEIADEVAHELADSAYFQGTVLVASAHNMPVESYPWRFSSVISVGSHEGSDSYEWYANPDPPVEFFARGVDVDVAWAGGSTLRCTGNSFAAPHIVGLSALVLSKHRDLTPFQLKSVLYLTAANTGGTE